jgi:hypothetical protein
VRPVEELRIPLSDVHHKPCYATALLSATLFFTAVAPRARA